MGIFRPELHVTAESGILEGPAGVLLTGAKEAPVWHMFYQYRPTPDSPSRWGHHASEGDPFSWVECNDALVPVGGETAVRAGSVVAVDEGVELYFTSATAAGNTIQIAHVANLSALCTDLDEDNDAAPGVQRLGDIVDESAQYNNFRSPCVVPDWKDDEREEHDGWIMLAVTGPTDAPQPVVLTSADARAWKLEGKLEFAGDPGISLDETLVAPRICRLRDEVDNKVYDVFFFTIERDGKDISEYIIGQLEGNIFHVVTPSQALDYGHDFTRPRNTNYGPGVLSPKERYLGAYLYGFMTASGRQGNPTAEPNWEDGGWANVLTLPRRLTLQNGHLYQVPAPGLPEAVSSSRRAKLWTAIGEIPNTDSAIIAEVLDGNGEVSARISHRGNVIEVDRLDGQPATAAVHDEDEDAITVIVDGSTLEVYASGGGVVMSSRIWPTNGCSGIRTRATGDAEIFSEWREGN